MLLCVCAFVCACLCEIEEKREGRKQTDREKERNMGGASDLWRGGCGAENVGRRGG